jgi:hypothetical protein
MRLRPQRLSLKRTLAFNLTASNWRTKSVDPNSGRFGWASDHTSSIVVS